MSAYSALLVVHLASVTLSGAGFFTRGLLMLGDSPLLGSRFARIAPHVNDTVLLAAAIGLCVVTGQYPFVHAWLTAKVVGLLAYIGIGSLALKKQRVRAKSVRAAVWLAALVLFAWIVSVALSKDPRGFFALNP